LEIPNRLPALQADPVRLRQILLNLLSNARKFTRRGVIALGAEVAPPYLHIWVRDTGIGIPIELQERIFEPFATLEQTKRRGEGIGLGLSITRRLVALHHGLMRLESQPGHGSTFHVCLPLPALDHRQATARTAGQAVLLWISSHDRPTPEIAAIAERQGLALRRLKAGDNLDKALAGVQAAAIAWDLPSGGADELALAQRLRAHPQFANLPLILYGASRSTPDQALGITSFVVKPVSGQTLQDIIYAMSLAQAAGSILIVDDDAQAIALYQSIAAQALPGCQVRTAAHGAEAIAMIREAPPAMVVLDLTMPEIDGFEVLDWMRANPPTRRVPVLVLSGRTLTNEDLKRLEQHAQVVYQSKDILSKAETAAALHQIMSGETLAQPTSALVKRSVVYLQQHYDRPLARREIALAIGVTENYLSRIFRQELALSPWEYLARYRIRQAKELLLASNVSIADIAAQVGFDDTAYFTRVFHKFAGCSPTVYRKHVEQAIFEH
jgi:CheY-like chemotaxis protein